MSKQYSIPEGWLKNLQQLAESLEKSLDDNSQTNMKVQIIIGYLRSIESILKYNEIDEA